MKKVLIIDTSILCVYLEVTGKTTCGSNNNQWNKQRVDELLEKKNKNQQYLFFPWLQL